MPIYEYECGKCENQFEVEQRITDEPIKTCPKCRSKRVKKLISRTSFVLKGSGWHSDLYSSGKPEKKPDGKTDDKTPDGDASGTSADKKKAAVKDKKKSKGTDKSSGKGSPKAAA
jgi:putative FmdB family regulatory protein